MVKLVVEPSSSLVPLKLELSVTRLISSDSWATSFCSAARSSALLVPLAACTASSRMRCMFSPIELSAPSAVWASEMPSLALRAATSMPRTWVVMRWLIARPAASSLALLMRRPEDRRWMVVARLALLVDRLRCAFSDITLVLMTCAILILLSDLSRREGFRALAGASAGGSSS